jgi:hypothetical protein
MHNTPPLLPLLLLAYLLEVLSIYLKSKLWHFQYDEMHCLFLAVMVGVRLVH